MATNDEQRAVLAILPKISACMSMAGSAWIVTEVATHRSKRKQVYHRVLLAMSVYDILESIWNFASTWPIPESTPNIHNPLGTTQTCTTQGFFLQLGLAIPIYNAWLSVYYYLLIGRGMTEGQIQHSHWELTMHLSAFIISFGTAMAAVFLDLFNNANLWCWIAPLPAGCDTNSNVPCVRGNNATIYRWAFYFGPLWTCIVLAILFVFVIYLKVRSLEVIKSTRGGRSSKERSSTISAERVAGEKFDPYDDEFYEESENDELETSNLPSSDALPSAEQPGAEQPDGRANLGLRGKTRTNTQQVMSQCLWYLAAFYMTHLFSTTNRIIQLAKDKTYFPLLVLHAWFDPLQGFLNFLVYRRPIYMRYRRFFPELPRYICWYRAFRWHFTYDPEVDRTQVLIARQRKRREQLIKQHAEAVAKSQPQESPNETKNSDTVPNKPSKRMSWKGRGVSPVQNNEGEEPPKDQVENAYTGDSIEANAATQVELTVEVYGNTSQ